jgi:hypothetical protein
VGAVAPVGFPSSAQQELLSEAVLLSLAADNTQYKEFLRDRRA